jgi:hypothetical protein
MFKLIKKMINHLKNLNLNKKLLLLSQKEEQLLTLMFQTVHNIEFLPIHQKFIMQLSIKQI